MPKFEKDSELPVTVEAAPRISESAGTLSECMLYVAAGAPGDRGRSLKLESGRALVGSAEECDLVVAEPTVSRQHASFTVVEHGVLIEDLGSRNGTFFLGQRIQSMLFQSSARIELGECVIDLLPVSDSKGLVLSTRHEYGALRGTSAPLRRLYSLLEMLEGSDVPVLIEGETGTGKEVVAREIYEHSGRAGKPFAIIDCASVKAELIESELFGHCKGAFTGAVSDRVGAFRAADGGTVFLDEIGELPLELQPTLLRALETGEVKRVGETSYETVNVRVLAATNRNLVQEVEARQFREDLFYRLAVVRLRMPPLRERREDIAFLARSMARDLTGGQVESLPQPAVDFFVRYDWPGNVRELRNAVSRILALGEVGLAHQIELGEAAAMSRGEVLTDDDGRTLAFKQARERALDEFEKAYITDLMARAGGNISEAARLAVMERKRLRDLLKKHGLYRES